MNNKFVIKCISKNNLECTSKIQENMYKILPMINVKLENSFNILFSKKNINIDKI